PRHDRPAVMHLRSYTQRNRLFHLHVKRKGMSMENRRLDQLNRWLQRVLAGDSLVVLQQSLPDRLQGRRGVRSVSLREVERHLGIENVLGQLLERQKVDGLFVQLVHALLPVFRSGLHYGTDNSATLAGFLRS